MQHICTHCGLASADGNLWCQRRECSATNLTEIIRKGERFGEIEIGSMLRVLRTATVYTATRDNQPILVKIAHADPVYPQANKAANAETTQYSEYLKGEARLLQQLLAGGKTHNGLPNLLPPSVELTLTDLQSPKTTPYGRTTYHGQLRYFVVFTVIEGEFLRDFLAREPQPIPKTAGWILLQLAETLLWLTQELPGYQNAALTPESVLLRTDIDGLLRPVLFDFGLYSVRESFATYTKLNEVNYQAWLGKFLYPAYTPPELLQTRTIQGTTDVYGLGLLYYEMLMGHSAYPYATQTDHMVRLSVQAGLDDDERFTRRDMKGDVTKLAESALQIDPSQRLPGVSVFAKAMVDLFGRPQPERKRRTWFNGATRTRILIIVAILLGGMALYGVIQLLSAANPI